MVAEVFATARTRRAAIGNRRLPGPFDWGYFRRQPCFPDDFVRRWSLTSPCRGSRQLSRFGPTAEIIERYGEEHIRHGKADLPIPRLGIRCSRSRRMRRHFPRRLYRMCEAAKTLLEPLNIARVIARPFLGEKPGAFKRPASARLTTPPPEATLLDRLTDDGGQIVGIGKIADIYAHRGISTKRKAEDNMGLFDETLAALDTAGDRTLVFTNFVDFDTLFGHRRNVAGCAAAFEAFDRRLPEIEAKLHRPAISFSSPPITAAIQPGAAPIMPASMSRCCSSGAGCRRWAPPDLRRHGPDHRSVISALAR